MVTLGCEEQYVLIMKKSNLVLFRLPILNLHLQDNYCPEIAISTEKCSYYYYFFFCLDYEFNKFTCLLIKLFIVHNFKSHKNPFTSLFCITLLNGNIVKNDNKTV